MKKNNRNNRGMALVIVLGIAGIILILGTVYSRMYTDSNPAARLQLDRIQADFLAKGIQNIAIYKIKKYPDFFIRSYRQYVYKQRTSSDSSLPKLDSDQATSPLPYEYFIGKTSNGGAQGILNGDYINDFIEPLNGASYTTDIYLINSKDFNSEAVEIKVAVQLKDKKAINTYKTTIHGDLMKVGGRTSGVLTE